jgi:hypothetical protein
MTRVMLGLYNPSGTGSDRGTMTVTEVGRFIVGRRYDPRLLTRLAEPMFRQAA